MDLSRTTQAEVAALLRLLAEWERRELALLMLERREAEREGGCIRRPVDSACIQGGLTRGCAVISGLSENIGVDLVPLSWLARSLAWIQGPQAHLTHQRLGPLAVDRVAALLQLVAQPPAAVERPPQVDLVDEPYHVRSSSLTGSGR
jgi:hypothetical protein